MSTKLARALLALIAVGVAGPFLQAQDSKAKAGSDFTKEQLEQMVAPIALYPDNLITAVLMASTYPLEVVEADRWLDKNKALKGKELEAALKEEDWDPSIKSLITVPEVLDRMSENLDWTRDLGDALLGQQAEVMDAVQRMRGKANAAGNLKTTEEQKVTVQQDQTIVIEPTNPEVVYVPEYGTAVYGGGWSYPEPYYDYMYPTGWGLVGLGAGMLVGGALWGDANWGWGHGDIDIDIDRYNNWGDRVNHNWQNRTDRNWGHHVDHRGGVRYRNEKTADRFGGKGGNRVSGDRARGRPSQLPANRPGAGAGNRPGAGPGGGPGGNRPGAGPGGGQRPGGGANRPSQLPSNRPGAGAGNRPSGGASQRPAQRPSGGYSGASRPGTDRSSSYRGNSSRGRSSGGGARGGGGRGGGGRGGGRGGRR